MNADSCGLKFAAGISMDLSRRTLLAASAALSLVPGLARAAGAVSIRLDPGRRIRSIPADFMGLSYEISSVAVPGMLSADNHAYVQLVRNLGLRGVIRVGGNTSDFSSYQAGGVPQSLPRGTIVNAENVRQLRGFLDAIGWKLIWGLDLGSDRLDNAVEEAQAVANAMGDRLLALQIGNEPDLFKNTGHRTGTYDYAAWHAEYRRFKSAIRATLPHVPFAGPDIAGGRVDWMESFARDEGGDIALLTAHHYIAGQADPASTIGLMLQEEKNYEAVLAKFQSIADGAHLPYRLCETASYSGGGKSGVSNSFAAALWVLDYLFVLASYGCSGVNLETGVNHLGWISHYTPISDDLMGHYGAAPEYYGLLAFTQAARGEQIAVSCDTGGVNLTAYAMRQNARAMTLAVINKDLRQDAAVEMIGAAPRQARVMRLSGSSLSALGGVTFGGASVSNDGTWKVAQVEQARIASGKALLDIPAGSAALITLTA
jgi:Glycosyl hydrolase family 79 C-terminal beta domain